METNGPPVWRAVTIASTEPLPTFLTAVRPNRTPFPSRVKADSLRFTSGGCTSIPMRRASSTSTTMRSVSPTSLLSAAAKKAAG